MVTERWSTTYKVAFLCILYRNIGPFSGRSDVLILCRPGIYVGWHIRSIRISIMLIQRQSRVQSNLIIPLNIHADMSAKNPVPKNSLGHEGFQISSPARNNIAVRLELDSTAKATMTVVTNACFLFGLSTSQRMNSPASSSTQSLLDLKISYRSIRNASRHMELNHQLEQLVFNCRCWIRAAC